MLEFKTLQQLYDHIKPALFAKQREMIKMGYTYIKMEDIWNYLKEVKWKNASDLSIYEMVSDVLNTDDILIDEYLKQKLKLKERKQYFEEESI